MAYKAVYKWKTTTIQEHKILIFRNDIKPLLS